MENTKMFCMQCEQTAGGKACTNAGVCGKTANTAKLQDELTGSLITAARKGVAIDDGLLLESLFYHKLLDAAKGEPC
jgi:hydroxylamine reductase